jgi:hypothetical protein
MKLRRPNKLGSWRSKELPRGKMSVVEITKHDTISFQYLKRVGIHRLMSTHMTTYVEVLTLTLSKKRTWRH